MDSISSYAWLCVVNLQPDAIQTDQELPDFDYSGLQMPVTCEILPQQLVFRGPWNGTGGSEFLCSAAKTALQSYINIGYLAGWHVVGKPCLYKCKLAFHSQPSWDNIGLSWGDKVDVVGTQKAGTEGTSGSRLEVDMVRDDDARAVEQQTMGASPENKECAVNNGHASVGGDSFADEVQPALQVDVGSQAEASPQSCRKYKRRLRGKRSAATLLDHMPKRTCTGAGLSALAAGAGSSALSAGADSALAAGAGSSAVQSPPVCVAVPPSPGAALLVSGAASSALVAVAGAGSPAPPTPVQFPQQSGNCALYCHCRGNCGCSYCRAAQNKATRKGKKVQLTDVFCARLPSPHRELCRKCRCEFCNAPRNKANLGGRWCDSCATQHSGPKLTYATPTGWHKFQPHWGNELKFVCRFNFVLRILDPGDVDASLQACSQVWHRLETPPSPGQLICPLLMSCMVWIHALKWPGAVRHFSRMFQEHTFSEDVAADLATMVIDSILYCHAQQWDDVFAGMHSGGATFSHGPVAIGKQLGLLDKIEGGAGLSALHSANDTVVRMGKERLRYVVRRSTPSVHNIVKHIFQATESAAIAWPADNAGVEEFACKLMDFTMSIRSHKDEHGRGLLGAGDANLYTVKHFMRFVFFQLEAMNIQLHAVSWDKLREWTPDKHHQCDLFRDQTIRDTEDLIGLPATRLAMFLCLAGKIHELNLTSQQWQKLLRVQESDVMKCLRKHESSHKQTPVDAYWPPGPKQLVQLLLQADYI